MVAYFSKISLAAFFLFSAVALHAQKNADTSFKRFGFQAGVNVSNMDFNKGSPTPPVHIPSSWQTGVSAGFFIRVPLGKQWLLQPEYNYTQRNGADKSTGNSYQLYYFTLPVVLRYKINSLLSLYAGPQGELLVHATSSSSGTDTKTNITHDTEERSIAVLGGVEVRLTSNFFISARYLYGFNHIGIGQRTANTKEFKYQSVNVTAGISF